MGRAYGMRGKVEKSLQGFGGKAQRKEVTRKTKAWMGGWDQNGSHGNWIGGCGLNYTGSGYGAVVSCCECGDEPSVSCSTELVRNNICVCSHFVIFLPACIVYKCPYIRIKNCPFLIITNVAALGRELYEPML
jgi:hypothetical protein